MLRGPSMGDSGPGPGQYRVLPSHRSVGPSYTLGARVWPPVSAAASPRPEGRTLSPGRFSVHPESPLPSPRKLQHALSSPSSVLSPRMW